MRTEAEIIQMIADWHKMIKVLQSRGDFNAAQSACHFAAGMKYCLQDSDKPTEEEHYGGAYERRIL